MTSVFINDRSRGSHDYTSTITTVVYIRAEGLLDLSRSSWLMAAARVANLFLGMPTCSVNERPSPVSCFGSDLFEEGLRGTSLSAVFKNGRSLLKTRLHF